MTEHRPNSDHQISIFSGLTGDPAEMRRAGKNLIQLADQLEQSRLPSVAPTSSLVPTPSSLQPFLKAEVEMAIEERAVRSRFVDPELLGEPAWDILLDLYKHALLGVRISVTSACLASKVPPTTGLRWVNMLERRGYILRFTNAEDKRRGDLELSASGRRMVEAWLIERAWNQGRLPPEAHPLREKIVRRFG